MPQRHLTFILEPPAAVPPATSPNQIIWNWLPFANASGYKWNTTNNYLTATDMGAATSKTETGVNCFTTYVRYVWAYNACTNSTSLSMSAINTACPFVCGTSTLTISHFPGEVAPIYKTTTYSTVTNIPGEPSKCWITKNLGADRTATAVNDATYESAGWYWQFNRRQGYRADGSWRSPNTPWITTIIENSDWLQVNDPCSLELGTSWRIPTKTEWVNVDNTGNWTNWNGGWNSGLKLHAAGLLNATNGNLSDRGTNGVLWSSSQLDTGTSWYLHVKSTDSGISYVTKASATTIRCIKE